MIRRDSRGETPVHRGSCGSATVRERVRLVSFVETSGITLTPNPSPIGWERGIIGIVDVAAASLHVMERGSRRKRASHLARLGNKKVSCSPEEDSVNLEFFQTAGAYEFRN